MFDPYVTLLYTVLDETRLTSTRDNYDTVFIFSDLKLIKTLTLMKYWYVFIGRFHPPLSSRIK